MYEKKNYYYDPSGGYYTSMSGRGQTDSGNSSACDEARCDGFAEEHYAHHCG